jgi:transcriptional regulator with PAS, ATPase and Fis domain
MNIQLPSNLKLTDSFYTAINCLNESACDSVPVIDDNKRLIGVFTKEILYRALLENIKLETKIEQYVEKFQSMQDGSVAINEPLLQSAYPQLTVSLNLIHRNHAGHNHRIIQLDPITNTIEDNHIASKGYKKSKAIKRWQNMIDTIIEQLYDGIVIVNKYGEILFLNHKIPDLFQVENENEIGKPVKEVIPILNLDKTLDTGVPDLSRVIELNGVLCIVQNIPFFEDGTIIGAFSRIIYHGINAVRERMIHFDLTYKMEEVLELIQRYEGLNKRNNNGIKKDELRYSPKISFDNIITEDLKMKKTIRYALKAAIGRSTILIRGESGTGKELFAQAIHNASVRKDCPFISVNCAAIPEHLLESEFFGYEPGAFTGAEKTGKIGKFDLANGGILFLDEIGDMAPSLQAKLLRVLQDKGFYRVGGMKQIHVDVRIIAATHRNLEEMIKNGEFREDLYYRLNVVTIDIPPLRERKDDIMLLTKKYMKELNKFLGTSIIGISPVVEEIFNNYTWPGNIRELNNVIESAMTFTDNRIIQKEDLPKHILVNNQYKIEMLHGKADHSNSMKPLFTEKKNFILEDARQSTEQEMIKQALKQTQGNKTKAAKMLGISRSVFYEKLAKYQMKSL